MSDLHDAFNAAEPDSDAGVRQERAWQVVRSAYLAREPEPRPSRRGRRLVVAAAVLVAAPTAIAATGAGRDAIDDLRRTIGIERAQPALFSLPTAGRLLVSTSDGAWVVARDGGKRYLGDYTAATWSPHGLYIAATSPAALHAIEPDGDVRWSLARPGVRAPRWSPSGYRIAYLDRSGLRVVAGDGSGDVLLSAAVAPVAGAWKPGTRHLLAYADRAGSVHLVDTDSRARLRRTPPGPAVEKIAWSGDGRRFYVQTAREVRIYRAAAWDTPWTAVRASPPEVVAGFAVRPGRHEVAVALWNARAARTSILCDAGSCRFEGAGAIAPLVWSPDGAWLLLGWERADQLVLVPAGEAAGIRAVANAARQFASSHAAGSSRPAIAGAEWCCAG